MSGRIQTGFSIVEVMIALFVLSIGMLGMASLQITSKQSGYEAVQRTTASLLAQDIIERMRMNSDGSPSPLIAYVSVNGTNTFDVIASTSYSTPAAPGTDCTSTDCSATELAVYDLNEWFEMVRGRPEQRNGANVGGIADPTVCLSGPTDGSSGSYTVTIAWRGQADLSNANASTCGQGNYGANDQYRRLLVLSTYITNQ